MKSYLYIFTALLMIAFFKYYTPIVFGYLGERKIASILSRLPKQNYLTINNVMLQKESGTTQIDHIVVSVFGIFVIETKNYTGMIIGNEYSEHWTKNMYGKKYKFQNPLRQNFGHILALKALLNVSDEKLISVVVFSDDAKLKVKAKHHVINNRDLKSTLLKYNERIFSENEIVDMELLIRNSNIDSKDNRKQHVKDIRKIIESKENSVKSGVCPKCSGLLVYRKGKNGEFIGCNNYPKCRYIAPKMKLNN